MTAYSLLGASEHPSAVLGTRKHQSAVLGTRKHPNGTEKKILSTREKVFLIRK